MMQKVSQAVAMTPIVGGLVSTGLAQTARDSHPPLAHREPAPDGSKHAEKIRRYRNSGVLQLNNDGWQAVNWQSTAIAEAPKK